MKRFVMVVLMLALGVQWAAPVLAARRVVVRKGPHRTTVVVHRTFPVRRAMPLVVVRPARTVVRVRPALFLTPVLWAPAVVTVPAHRRIVWREGETLEKREGWTEFTMGVDRRGPARRR